MLSELLFYPYVTSNMCACICLHYYYNLLHFLFFSFFFFFFFLFFFWSIVCCFFVCFFFLFFFVCFFFVFCFVLFCFFVVVFLLFFSSSSYFIYLLIIRIKNLEHNWIWPCVFLNKTKHFVLFFVFNHAIYKPLQLSVKIKQTTYWWNFLGKKSFDISCNFHEMLILFSGKNKKNISKCRLLKFYPACCVKVTVQRSKRDPSEKCENRWLLSLRNCLFCRHQIEEYNVYLIAYKRKSL